MRDDEGGRKKNEQEPRAPRSQIPSNHQFMPPLLGLCTTFKTI